MNIAEFPISTLLNMVASLLESVVDANDRLVSSRSGDSITVFHSRAVPNIKVKAYLSRILKYTPFNNEVLLCILVYFDRIAQLRPGTFVVNSYNIHRLLIASIVVASKFTSDVFYPNSRYAKVGGLPLLELNKLEMEFLFLCDFELHVHLEAMQEYGDNLLAHSRSQQQLEVPVDPVNRKRSRTSSSEEHTIINIKNSHSSHQHHVHLPLTPPYTITSPRAIKRRR